MKRPLSLTIIAWVFILLASLSLFQMVWEMSRRRLGLFDLGLAILFFVIGLGLFALRPGARRGALVVIVCGWLLLGTLVVLAVFNIGELHVGSRVITRWRGKFLMMGFCNAFALFLGWMTWVLLRRDVKVMFYSRGAS